LVAAVLPLPVSGLPTLVAEAAWTTDPLATPSWVTIPRCRTLKVTGNHRSAALGRFDAGIIVATFGNRDRSLEPLYAGGANYPNVKLRKRVRFRAAAHAGTGTSYPIAVGFVEKVVPTYPKNWKDAASTLTASDAFRLFAGAQLVNPYVAEVLKDAPSMYYRLQEAQATAGSTSAIDISSNNRNGTYAATGVTYQVASPIVDSTAKAVTLAGAGSMTVPTLALPGAFSVEAWINTTTTGPVDSPFLEGVMVPPNVPNPGTSWAWLLEVSPTNAAFIVVDSSFGGVFAKAQSSIVVNDGQWHHIVGARDGTGHLTVYVDGQVAGTDIGGTLAFDRTAFTVVGGDGFYFSRFPGSIAEPALYAGVALSAARVAAHYAARSAWLNDSSDARTGHILDQLGWPAGDRDLDAGVAVLTDAGDLAGQKALDHFRLIDATEGGCLTASRDGKVMMRNRHSIQSGPARNTVSQATFGDQGGTEIGYTALGMAFDDTELANRVTVTRRNGITAVVFDQAQITASGVVQDHAQNSISNSDVDATAQAQWLLALLKNPNRWRFETIVVPLTDTNQDAVLGLEKWDRVTAAFTPMGGGTRIVQDVLIVGIDHDVTKPGHWDVTFHTTGTDLQLTPFILDMSLLDGSAALVF
jgi:hypothetical protein